MLSFIVVALVSFQSNRTVSKTEVFTRFGYCYDRQCVGEMWILEFWDRKPVGPLHRNVEDSIVDNLNCVAQLQEVSQGKTLVSYLETILIVFGKECDCFLSMS